MNGKSLTAAGAKQNSSTTTGAKEGSMATDNGGETITKRNFNFY